MYATMIVVPECRDGGSAQSDGRQCHEQQARNAEKTASRLQDTARR